MRYHHIVPCLHDALVPLVSGRFIMKIAAFLLGLGLAFSGQASAQGESSAQIDPKEADKIVRKVASYCQITLERMNGVISQELATQDLRAFASIWDSLNCNEIFNPPSPVSERPEGRGEPRWIVR